MSDDAFSLQINYDSGKRRRVAIFAGAIGDEHLLDVFESMLAQPTYVRDADDLVDLTRVTRIDVTVEGLRRLIGKLVDSEEGAVAKRVALVAPSNVVYGVARMYQMMRGDRTAQTLHVFRERQEAEAWLDTEPEQRGSAAS